MNDALCHFCAHTAYIVPREPPEGGEMNQMISLTSDSTSGGHIGDRWDHNASPIEIHV